VSPSPRGDGRLGREPRRTKGHGTTSASDKLSEPLTRKGPHHGHPPSRDGRVKGSKRGIPPVRRPARRVPTQVAARRIEAHSVTGRKDCHLTHTSPAPRVSGRPSRSLRTNVERRSRPSARSSRGRTLLAASDASHATMVGTRSPSRMRLARERGKTGTGAKRASSRDRRMRRSAGWRLRDRDT
jgi:hypothetical protein